MNATNLLACVTATLLVTAGAARGEPESTFKLRVRGLVTSDLRAFVGTPPLSATERSTFAVRAAGPQLDVTLYRRLGVQLLANLVDRTSPVTLAFVEVDGGPHLHVRTGKFPFPLTQERLTPPLSLPFVGSSLVGLLVPALDTGVHARGTVGPLDYDLAVVNGAVAGGSGDSDLDSGKDVVGRAFVSPFAATDLAALSQLGIGLGVSWGDHRGRLAAPGTSVLRTYGGQPFFAYRSDGTPEGTSLANGAVLRIAPHLVWAAGPVALQADAILVRERVGDARVELRAVDVIPSVTLTGEDAAPLAFVVPKRPLGGPEGGIGAVLLVAGAGILTISDDAFRGAADPSTAAAGMTVLGGGLKWYPVAGLAVFVDYGHMTFRTAPGGVRRANEDTLVTRVQVIF